MFTELVSIAAVMPSHYLSRVYTQSAILWPKPHPYQRILLCLNGAIVFLNCPAWERRWISPVTRAHIIVSVERAFVKIFHDTTFSVDGIQKPFRTRTTKMYTILTEISCRQLATFEEYIITLRRTLNSSFFPVGCRFRNDLIHFSDIDVSSWD